ncbi:hypothetical protein ACFLXH_01490 [Chloroflexota bacterium]
MTALKEIFTSGNRKRATGEILCMAVHAKQLVEFYYHGGSRLVEPYCVGVSLPSDRVDNEVLICYQTSGYVEIGESLGWKMFRLVEIMEAKIIKQTFQMRSEYDTDIPGMVTIRCCVLDGEAENTRVIRGKVPVVESSLTHNELMRRFRFSHPFFWLAKKTIDIGCAIMGKADDRT